MISATDALRQASSTAHDYFIAMQALVEQYFPKASPDAKLAATVELCKVAATDFILPLSGVVDGALAARKLGDR